MTQYPALSSDSKAFYDHCVSGELQPFRFHSSRQHIGGKERKRRILMRRLGWLKLLLRFPFVRWRRYAVRSMSNLCMCTIGSTIYYEEHLSMDEN